MLARHALPVTGNTIQDERRRQDRTRHFLQTDPAGSWVAEDEGIVVGMSQSFVREDYWMLSQLGTLPGRQGRGVGRELLRLALTHGDPSSPGTIQCSRDPKAMALYTSFGFVLHPVVAAWGAMRPGAVERPAEVVRFEPDQVTERELGIVTAIDRKVRGSARSVDIVSMLAQPGHRLLLHGEQGYAVARDDRVVTLGARDESSATLVLKAMLAEAPAGRDDRDQLADLRAAMGDLRGSRSGHRVAALRAGHGAGHGRPAVAVHPEWRVRVLLCGRHDTTADGQAPLATFSSACGERTQADLPAAVRADCVAHALPAVAHAVEVAVFDLHAGAPRCFGDETHLDLAALRGIRLELPLHVDVPAEHDPMRGLVGEDPGPVALAAVGPDVVDVTALLGLEHHAGERRLEEVMFRRPPAAHVLGEHGKGRFAGASTTMTRPRRSDQSWDSPSSFSCSLFHSGLEGVQRGTPEALEVVPHAGEAIGVEAVDAARPNLDVAHEARLLQYLQVLRDSRAADGQAVGQVHHGGGALAELLEDARRVGRAESSMG